MRYSVHMIVPWMTHPERGDGISNGLSRWRPDLPSLSLPPDGGKLSFGAGKVKTRERLVNLSVLSK
jgi:hypothetical protein